MYDTLVAKVVRRFLATSIPLTVVADARFKPPRGILNGVETGELPREVLNVWKYVVERQGEHYQYDACVEHWRNKCARMNIVLPQKYIKELGGKGGAGRWAVTAGEQVEDWVKENLKSEGLMDGVGRSVYDWTLWIEHWEHEIEKALELVDTHTKALGKAKSDKGVAQRIKWLNGARTKLGSFTDELEKAKKALDDLMKVIERHAKAKSPTVEFEKEFQFLVLLAMKEFDKEAVRKAVETALERVEQGMDIPGGESAFNVENYEPGFKSAGLFDALGKAWDWLLNKFDALVDWVGGILRITNKLEGMLKAAGA